MPMEKVFCYLVAIMDWHSRKVLSWRLSNTLDADFCVQALEATIQDYGCPQIMNTDQDVQLKGATSDIHNRTVGYLNREQARSFHRRLDEKRLSNRITTCNAIITGGGEVNGEILDYSVKLDIEPFESHNPKITVGLP